MKNKNSAFLWGGTLVVILLILGGLSYVIKSSPAKQPMGDQTIATETRADDHVTGSGPLVLVEYADYQCPACAAYYPIVKQLEKDFEGKVTFVYRYFPLFQIHQNANYSAYAAEAAGLQGKFWQMHDVLYAHQTEWSERLDAKVVFKGYAESLGMDGAKFLSDFDSDAVHARVRRDYDEADRLGLSGTPSFFFNGKKIDNPRNYEAFRALIQASIK